MASVSEQTGPVATVSGLTLDLHISTRPFPSFRIELTFRGVGSGVTGFEMAINGGPTVTGDRLVLIPGQMLAVDFLSEVLEFASQPRRHEE
jgi:hypothetical protein